MNHLITHFVRIQSLKTTSMTEPYPFNRWNSLHEELVSFVYKKVKDKATAEDIVQDVFIRAHSKIEQLKETGKFTGWIYQITRNTVADYYRNRARHLVPVPIDSESDEPGFNDCVGQCLTVLMRTLPDIYRIPLELTEHENLSQVEVAERLSISYSGARSRVQRARKMLREKFEALFITQSDAYGNILVCENRHPCNCPKEIC